MDDELTIAIAELRHRGEANGWSMEHLSDRELLQGFQQAVFGMPEATVEVIKDYGLTQVAPVLMRLLRESGDTRH